MHRCTELDPERLHPAVSARSPFQIRVPSLKGHPSVVEQASRARRSIQYRTAPESSKPQPSSVVSRVTMLNRTELFPTVEVLAHRRPSRISQQLAAQGRISLSEVIS